MTRGDSGRSLGTVVDHEHRLSVDIHVTPVEERGQQGLEMAAMVFHPRIGLLDQHAVRCAMPDAAPGLIRPAQAERKIRLAGGQHLVERTLEEALAGKPVVVVAECLDADFSGHVRLGVPRLRKAQVVETEVRRDVRLVMALEKRCRFRGIRPFGETLPPPFVVLGNRVILR